jgi:hypothetical protein
MKTVAILTPNTEQKTLSAIGSRLSAKLQPSADRQQLLFWWS